VKIFLVFHLFLEFVENEEINDLLFSSLLFFPLRLGASALRGFRFNDKRKTMLADLKVKT